MERYEVISLDESCYYIKNTDLIVQKSALTKDNEKNLVLVQIKFKSFCEKVITSLVITITCKDIEDKDLGKKRYQYLDLSVHKNDVFGDRVPVYLEDNTTRKYSIEVEKIVYEEGETLLVDDGKCYQVPSESFPITGVLKEQYIRHFKQKGYEIKVLNKPCRFDRFWKCSCGEINSLNATACVSCRCSLDELESNLSLEKIEKDLEEYNLQEAQKAEERKTRNKALIRKGIIAAAVLIALIIAYQVYAIVLQPAIQYNNAQKYCNEGQYEEAIELFTNLGEYKDSPEQLSKAKYDWACEYFDNNEFDQAVALFRELGDYSDSSEKILEVETAHEYEKALQDFERGLYKTAAEVFDKDLSYKDSAYYAGCCYKELKMFDRALTCFEQVPNSSSLYKDVGVAIDECNAAIKDKKNAEAYDEGVDFAKKGYLYSAKEKFEECDSYSNAEDYLEIINKTVEEGWLGVYKSDGDESDRFLGIYCIIDSSLEKTYIASVQDSSSEYLYSGIKIQDNGTFIAEDTINNTVDVECEDEFIYLSKYRYQKDKSIYDRKNGIYGRGSMPGTTTRHYIIFTKENNGITEKYNYETKYFAGTNKGTTKSGDSTYKYKRVGDEYEK